MRLITLLILSSLLLFALPSVAQTRAGFAKPSTLTGTYETRRNRGAGGTLLVRQQAEGKIEFELECNRGAPSYSSGIVHATVDVNNRVAVYKSTEFGSCEMKLEFKGSRVLVTQTGSAAECGLGNGVRCTGEYRLKSRRPPKFEQR